MKNTLYINFKVWDYWVEDNYNGTPTIHMVIEFLGKLHLWSQKEKICE